MHSKAAVVTQGGVQLDIDETVKGGARRNQTAKEWYKETNLNGP